MKFALTLVFALSLGMAFADGKGCASCCKSAYKAKPFDKKDAHFLAMANDMAAGKVAKKSDCCAKPSAKVAKKADCCAAPKAKVAKVKKAN